MLTTAELKPLELPPLLPRRQYLVSVEPMDKTALDVAHVLWSMLPGTVRVIPRGMVYFSDLSPLHMEMFGDVVPINEKLPAKTFYVGQYVPPEVIEDEQGKRTVLPADPAIIAVATAQAALDIVAAERVANINARHKAERDAFAMKWIVAGKIVAIAAAVAYLAWYMAVMP